jgi:c-di-GMP-binding flagellar brake protein YcgR
MIGKRQNNGKKEKRRQARKTLVAKVTYRVLMNSKGETLTQNISEGGLCLILNRELALGSTLEVNIDMPGQDPKSLEILAEVVWQKKTEMGFVTGIKFGS